MANQDATAYAEQIVADYGKRATQEQIADALREQMPADMTCGEFMDLVDTVQRLARDASVVAIAGI